MKMRKFLSVFMVSVLGLALNSCSFNSKPDEPKGEEIAQANVEMFFEKKVSESFSGLVELIEFRHSDLYIYTPRDSSRIITPIVDLNDSEARAEQFFRYFAEASVGVSLSVGGCGRGEIDNIIKHDKDFLEWETGGEEYIMVTFAKAYHKDYGNTEELGLCFRLDSLFNIVKFYSVEEDDADYVYMRIFGQSQERFIGAVMCDYNYRVRMYEYYTKELRNYVSNIHNQKISDRDDAVARLKFLNELFGYERFDLMDKNNRNAAIKNCLKQLDSYTDKKALKNKSYEIVKSFDGRSNQEIIKAQKIKNEELNTY